MKKYICLCIFALSAVVSIEASALTINGINYKLVSSSAGLCPDGSKKVLYLKKPYCRYYKANLSWKIPTTRLNGTPLKTGELQGYEVYWTRNSDTTKGTIKVSGGTNQLASLEVFKPDMYYFAISAVDTKGLKSPLSTLVGSRLGN